MSHIQLGGGQEFDGAFLRSHVQGIVRTVITLVSIGSLVANKTAASASQLSNRTPSHSEACAVQLADAGTLQGISQNSTCELGLQGSKADQEMLRVDAQMTPRRARNLGAECPSPEKANFFQLL